MVYTGYINLENYIKNIIVQCIGGDGYVECGHLRYMIDLHLAAGPDNVEFLPSEVKENFLIIRFREPTFNSLQEKSFNIEEIVEECLRR